MLTREFIANQIPVALASVLLTALLAVAIYFGAPAATGLEINGVDLSTAANLAQLLGVAVPILLVAIFVALALLRGGATWLMGYLWPRVGADPVPAHRRDALLEGLDGQREIVERDTSWPSHMASARPATSASRIHFGDARFSTPGADLRAIRKFIGRPRRKNGAHALHENVLIITGEPGAGKSVLTQEMHASLVDGIRNAKQYLIPLIVFASDLTLSLSGRTNRMRRSSRISWFPISVILERAVMIN